MNIKAVTQEKVDIMLDPDTALKLLQRVYCYMNRKVTMNLNSVDFLKTFVTVMERNNIKMDKKEKQYIAMLQSFAKTAPPYYNTTLQSVFECYNDIKIDMLRNKINKIKAAL